MENIGYKRAGPELLTSFDDSDNEWTDISDEFPCSFNKQVQAEVSEKFQNPQDEIVKPIGQRMVSKHKRCWQKRSAKSVLHHKNKRNICGHEMLESVPLDHLFQVFNTLGCVHREPSATLEAELQRLRRDEEEHHHSLLQTHLNSAWNKLHQPTHVTKEGIRFQSVNKDPGISSYVNSNTDLELYLARKLIDKLKTSSTNLSTKNLGFQEPFSHFCEIRLSEPEHHEQELDVTWDQLTPNESVVSHSLKPQQTQRKVIKVCDLNWLEDSGVYFVSSLNPTYTVEKIKQQYSHLTFQTFTISNCVHDISVAVQEVCWDDVILVNCGKCSITAVIHLLYVLHQAKNLRCVLYSDVISEHNASSLLTHLCSVVIDELKWDELSKHKQAQLLEKPLMFQNQKYVLRNFLTKHSKEKSEFLSSLSPEFLYQLAQAEMPTLCPANLQQLPPRCIPRQVQLIGNGETTGNSEKLTEVQLVKMLCENSLSNSKNVICIMGDVGSGKTTVLMKLENLLHKYVAKSTPPVFVRYFRMRQFLKILKERDVTLETTFDSELFMDTIMSLLANDKFTDQYLRMPGVKCELLLDDLDQVSICYLIMLLKYFNVVQNDDNLNSKFRLWFSFCSKITLIFKKYFDAECYQIVPLDSYQRENLFLNIDKSNFVGFMLDKDRIVNFEEESLHKKALTDLCLNSLTEFEENFTRTPVYSRLLAQSYPDILFAPDANISPFRLFQRFAELNVRLENQEKTFSRLAFYQKLAIEKLFPTHVEIFKFAFSDIPIHQNVEEVEAMVGPVFIHQTVAEYFVVNFVFKLFKGKYAHCIELDKVFALILDMLSPYTILCTENNSSFWHHNILDRTTQMIPYFFEGFLSSMSKAELNSMHIFHKALLKIYNDTPLTKDFFQEMADLSRHAPILTECIARSLGSDYEPVKLILGSSVGCKLFNLAIELKALQTEKELQTLMKLANTPVKLVRYIIHDSVLRYIREEYGIVEESNGRFNKYQRDRIRSVENAFYWKLMYLVVQVRYPEETIDSLDTITSVWFAETDSDISKLRIIRQIESKDGIKCKLSDSVFEEYLLAEFVFRMATLGRAVDSIDDTMQVSVKILLNNWKNKTGKSLNNPFSFIALLNSLILDKKVESNFMAVLCKQISGEEEFARQKFTEFTKILDTYVIIENTQKCKNSTLNEVEKPVNVINMFIRAFTELKA